MSRTMVRGVVACTRSPVADAQGFYVGSPVADAAGFVVMVVMMVCMAAVAAAEPSRLETFFERHC